MPAALNLAGQRFGSLVAQRTAPGGERTRRRWECRCDCGAETRVTTDHLVSGHIRSCGCSRRGPEIAGQRFGKLTVLRETDKGRGYRAVWYEARCDCGALVTMAKHHFRKNVSCGCDRAGYRGAGDVPGSYWYRVTRSARVREIEVAITIGDAWALFLAQGGRCALTGRPLVLVRNYTKMTDRSMTASLDRIDSDKGYVPGNVQWVHKDVNMMKKEYPQEEFIAMCRLVAARHPEH